MHLEKVFPWGFHKQPLGPQGWGVGLGGVEGGDLQSLRTTLGFVSHLGAQEQCCADPGVVFSGSSSFTLLLPLHPGKHLNVVPALLTDILPRAQLVVESKLFDKKTLSFLVSCLGLIPWQSFLLLPSQDL